MSAVLAPPVPSRESFLALYWDHARELPRETIAAMAGLTPADVYDVLRCEWDALLERHREPMRRSILYLLECHEYKRIQDRERAA